MTLKPNILSQFHENGFVYVSGDDMRNALSRAGSLADWNAFADSWNDLHIDTYMADKGSYRKRRYAVFAVNDGIMIRQPHQAHFQTLDYNPLNGGVARWFETMRDDIADGQSLRSITDFCCEFFGDIGAIKNWYVEAHQFRIEASADEKGQPTPEGIHRDGRDYVLVLMIRRQNIESGTTTIYNLHKKQIGSFTLTETFDAALVDDNRVYHGVTAITPHDLMRPAYRDVLVLTFKAIVS